MKENVRRTAKSILMIQEVLGQKRFLQGELTCNLVFAKCSSQLVSKVVILKHDVFHAHKEDMPRAMKLDESC